MKINVVRWLGLVVLLVISGSTAMAVGHRQINGHVESAVPWLLPARYIPVPSFIDIYTVDGQFVTRVTSDENGYFIVAGLKPAEYTVMATAVTPRFDVGRYRPSFPVTVNLRKYSESVLDLFLPLITN